MTFPTTLTNAVDGATDVLAEHINNLEAKVGIDGSAVTTSHDYKLSSVTSTAKAVSTAGDQTVAGDKTFSGTVKTDTIAEASAGTGVTIDGVLIKDDLDTSNVVTKTTAQSVSGVKTLTAGIKLTEQSAPDTPAANDIHVYAKDKSGVSALYVKNDGGTESELGAALQTKCLAFTRDMTASTGDVSYTTIGFQPKAISFIAWINGTNHWGIGHAALTTTQGGITGTSGGASNTITGYNDVTSVCVFVETAAATGQYATLKSFDSDGFTLTWTKAGSPASETLWVNCVCFG